MFDSRFDAGHAQQRQFGIGKSGVGTGHFGRSALGSKVSKSSNIRPQAVDVGIATGSSSGVARQAGDALATGARIATNGSVPASAMGSSGMTSDNTNSMPQSNTGGQ